MAEEIKEEKPSESKPSENKETRAIIATRIKDILHEGNIRSSDDFIDAVNEKVIEMCRKVVSRCKGNNRSTAKICDL